MLFGKLGLLRFDELAHVVSVRLRILKCDEMTRALELAI